MRLRDKLVKGAHLVRTASGVRGKLATMRQLARVAGRSRQANKPEVTAEDVAANTWAEFHLLRLVSRDMNVRVDRAATPRVWFVIPELDPKMIFGGYIALFQFIRFVQGLGLPTGVLALAPIPDRAALLDGFAGNDLVRGVLAQAETGSVGVGRTVRLGAGDMLVSYNWTSSLVAARMARFLDDPAYYYFVQEDERIFYPNDSYRFLCESVFHTSPRPRLIVNSDKLYRHFLREGLADPDGIAGVFEQGLPPADLPDAATLASRSPRRFGFYGRPEDHAKRNLMTVALLAIAEAKRRGAFAAEPWEFVMVGSSRMGESFDLDGARVVCLPNQGYDAYRRTLASFDVGMCLMYAPHPSVPPFEMVRSGVVTVVNTTAMRPAEWYRGISGNFEPAEPTVDGLAAAIGRATARVGDGAARLAAAHSYHPATWDDSLAHLPREMNHRIFDGVLNRTNGDLPRAGTA